MIAQYDVSNQPTYRADDGDATLAEGSVDAVDDESGDEVADGGRDEYDGDDDVVDTVVELELGGRSVPCVKK